jgi:hypothetical protein
MGNQESERKPPAGINGWGIVLFAVVAGLTRLVPGVWNLWNFKPVGGLFLFTGARYRSWRAYLVPLVVMLATDLLLIPAYARMGFSAFQWWMTPFVYVSFLLNVLIGRLLQRTSSPLAIGGASLACSAQFFVLTNFGSWLGGYPWTLDGLVECYWRAVPFWRATAASDLLGTGTFFALHAGLVYLSAREKASEPV